MKHYRLATMMFLQYFIWGAWFVTAYPVLSRYGFGADDIKWTYSAGPIAAMISPLIVGYLADRWFALQKLIAVMHGLAAVALVGVVYGLQQEVTSPWWVNVCFFLHMLFYMPTIALTNAIALRHLSHPQLEFPRVRFFGCVGWIAAGGLISVMKFDTSLASFYIAIVASLVMACYSLSLPNSLPMRHDRVSFSQVLGLNSLYLLKQRSYAVFLLAMFLLFIPISFYFQLGAKFVAFSGIERVASVMSLGQVSELVFMLLLPFALKKYGMKPILVIGSCAWVLRYLLFSMGYEFDLLWCVIAAIILHGICYDFCFVAGTIHVEETAPEHLRAQAQGFFMLVTYGLGMFIGAQVAGVVESSAVIIQSNGQVLLNWNYVWLVPAVVSVLVLMLLLLFFRTPSSSLSERKKLVMEETPTS
jgi:nucleoside transporter